MMLLIFLLMVHAIGITLALSTGISVMTKAVVLAGVFDIPAKSDVLGMVNHRAKYACSRCLHPGRVLTTSKGKMNLHIQFTQSMI